MKNNMSKKSYLLTLLIGSVVAVGSNVSIASILIPDEPRIEYPVDLSVNIIKTPTLSVNLATAKNSESQVEMPVNLVKSEFMLYKNDPTIKLVGGSQLVGIESEDDIPVITIPFLLNDVMFDGHAVTKMEIGQLGFVNFKDDADVILARVDTRITSYQEIMPALDEALMTIKTYNDSVLIQWHHKSKPGALPEWNNTAEAVITSDSQLAIRYSNHNLSSKIFEFDNGNVGCSMALKGEYQGPISKNVRSLASWKVAFESQTNDFSLLCVEDSDSNTVKLKGLARHDLTDIFSPTITKFDSDNADYTLKSDQALLPNTDYIVQSRHTIKDQADMAAVPLTQTSQWSQPVTFATVPAKTTYAITAPNTTKYKVNTPTKVKMTVTNTGAETGQPVIDLLLPLNFLTNVNGTVSDFYTADVAGNGSCSIKLISNETLLTCNVTSLAPGESVIYSATITMTDSDQDDIDYRVCEKTDCYFTEYFDVDVSVLGNQTAVDSKSDDSNDNSGAGGTLIYFLALAGLIGRRFK